MDEISSESQTTDRVVKVRKNGWIENSMTPNSSSRLLPDRNTNHDRERRKSDTEQGVNDREYESLVIVDDAIDGNTTNSEHILNNHLENNFTGYAKLNTEQAVAIDNRVTNLESEMQTTSPNVTFESEMSDEYGDEETVIENIQNSIQETDVVTALISDSSDTAVPVPNEESTTRVDIHCSDNVDSADYTDSRDISVDCEADDTFTSMIDLEKINSIKSKRSSSKKSRRKESFEQRLRRTFTIKDEHQSEVAKRILALVVKYSLFVFNFLSWVMATGGIGIGIWMMCDRTIIITTNTDIFLDPPKLTVIGGGITFIVALLGCVGALRENLVLLKVFFYVLSVILIGEMILGLTVFIIYTVPQARDNFLRSQPEKLLQMAIAKYMDDQEIKTWVDMIQSRFKCCGISHTDEGFRDWSTSPYFNCTPSNKSIYRCAVPMSCCIFEAGDRVNTMCGFEMTDKPKLLCHMILLCDICAVCSKDDPNHKKVIEVRDYIFVRGCMQGFGEWLSKYDELIIVSCLSVLIMQFLAVLSAKLMVVRITKKRSRWKILNVHRRYSSYTSNSATMQESD